MSTFTSLESSLLEAVKYEPEAETLHVRLRDGTLLTYPGVNEAVYQGLLAAKSKGRYFWAEIALPSGDDPPPQRENDVDEAQGDLTPTT